MEKPIGECVVLEPGDGGPRKRGVLAVVAEHVVPLQNLMEDDSIDETAEPDANQEPGNEEPRLAHSPIVFRTSHASPCPVRGSETSSTSTSWHRRMADGTPAAGLSASLVGMPRIPGHEEGASRWVQSHESLRSVRSRSRASRTPIRLGVEKHEPDPAQCAVRMGQGTRSRDLGRPDHGLQGQHAGDVRTRVVTAGAQATERNECSRSARRLGSVNRTRARFSRADKSPRPTHETPSRFDIPDLAGVCSEVST